MNLAHAIHTSSSRIPPTGRTRAPRLAAAVVALLALIGGCFGYVRSSGWTVYTLHGHSMEPTITPGSLVVARTVRSSDLEVGDIAVFRVGWLEAESRVMAAHRIELLAWEGERVSIFTKGDGNAVSDPIPSVLGETALQAAFTVAGGATLLRLAQLAGLVCVAVAGYLALARRLVSAPRRACTAEGLS